MSPERDALVYNQQVFKTFTANASREGSEDKIASPLMVASILTGLGVAPLYYGSPWYGIDDSTFRNNLFECPSENCTFGLYSTLDVCPKCMDATSSITLRDGVYSALNDSLTLSDTDGLANMTSDTSYPTSSAFADSELGPLIVHYQAMARAQTNQTPVAMECVAFWCVTTFSAQVDSNILSEEYLTAISDYYLIFDPDSNTNNATFTNGSTSARTEYGQKNDITLIPPVSWLNDTQQYNTSFTVLHDAQEALQHTLMTGFSGVEPLLHGSVVKVGNSSRSSSLAAHLIFGGEGPYDNWDGWNLLDLNLTEPFTNLTHYMGYAVRMSESSLGFGASYGYSVTASLRIHIRCVTRNPSHPTQRIPSTDGIAGRWPWIAYPWAVVVLVGLFLGGTMYMSKNHGLWKSSSLPILIHGLNDKELSRNLATPADMRRDAKHRQAWLENEAEGSQVWKTTNGQSSSNGRRAAENM